MINLKSNRQSGFSLIQLSIVIVIASIGLAAAAKLATVQFQQDREERLDQSFEDINDLLLAYYIGVDKDGNDNERLPCPARRDLEISHPNFGAEACGSVTITAHSTLTHPDTGMPLRVMIGALPTRELSMATEDAFDVFGGQLLYAVSEEMTSNTSFGRNDVAAIQRRNTYNKILGQNLPFIVISAGETGRGTYNKAGTLIAACPASGNERENCDNNAVFLDFDIAESTTNADNFFDDRIGYDGRFLGEIARFQVPDFNCPMGEVITGFLNGTPICNEDAIGEATPNNCPNPGGKNGQGCGQCGGSRIICGICSGPGNDSCVK